MAGKDKSTTKDFEEQLKETKASEAAEQSADDAQALSEVVEGRQEVSIEGFGTVIFDFPDVGLALEGDTIMAKFRTKALRSGDFLTQDQLKAIYRQPTTIAVDGKDIVVGTGEWPEKYDQELEDLPSRIQEHLDMFTSYRADYQELDEKLLTEKKTTKAGKELIAKQAKTEENAKHHYTKVLEYKSRQLHLNAIFARLFNTSLEEQAFFEKVKFFAPACIKKHNDTGDAVPLWNTEKEMLACGFNATRVLTLFNMFMRGLDVSFFGDVPDGTTLS